MIPYKSNTKDGPILDSMTTHILQSLGLWYGRGSHLDRFPPEIRSYRNCFILRYPVTNSQGARKPILVKIRRNPKMVSLWQAVSADIHANIPIEYDSLLS